MSAEEVLARSRELISLHKRDSEGQRMLELLPQGHGSGLDADMVDGLHAVEIIAKAKAGVRGGGGGGGGGTGPAGPQGPPGEQGPPGDPGAHHASHEIEGADLVRPYQPTSGVWKITGETAPFDLQAEDQYLFVEGVLWFDEDTGKMKVTET